MREPEMFTNAQVRTLETIARGLGARDEQERIIKLLREKAKHLKQVSESIAMDDYKSEEDAAVPENGAYCVE